MDNLKVKNRELSFKACLTNVKDIDDKGIVQFYASIFTTPDKINDVVEKGAYQKTAAENFKYIQHYKNHDNTLMPGVIKELTEDNTGLLATSKLILKTQLGMETYEEYKAMAEADKSMQHSIGYVTVKEEKDGRGFNHLKEIYLHEVSTLTKRAMHPGALTVGVKSFESFDFDELVKEEIFYTNLLKCKFSDAKLEQLENIKNHISSLINELSRKNALDNDIEPTSKDELLTALIGGKTELLNALKTKK